MYIYIYDKTNTELNSQAAFGWMQALHTLAKVMVVCGGGSVRERMYTYLRVYIHAYVTCVSHMYVYTYVSVCRPCIHLSTCTNIYIPIRAHTHTHTHTHTMLTQVVVSYAVLSLGDRYEI